MLGEEDVREILRMIDESPLDELRIETDGFSLHVLRGGATASESAPAPPARAGAPAAGAPPAGGTPEQTAAAAPSHEGAVIEAPMLGTFYRAEAPGATPFVEVGTRVEPDTIVCLIEVMKMMNSVPARVSGTIVEIFAENSVLVEYGQPLFVVEPAAG
jgi:acetyl-CoA carboxylase biotin carboxyl carrier protein